MKTNAFRRLVLAAAPCFLFSACAQPATVQPQPICNFNAMMASPAPASPAEAPVQPALIEAPLNSVSITDFRITNKVMVQAANARRHGTGTLEIWARLVNCTDFPLQVEGRTHFLDEGKAPSEKASAWSRVFLSPRSYGVYSESSTDVSRVRYYYVEIREGH